MNSTEIYDIQKVNPTQLCVTFITTEKTPNWKSSNLPKAHIHKLLNTLPQQHTVRALFALR